MLHLEEEDEEFFWEKLLRRGAFEVEVLLENNDLDEEEAWLLEAVSFFDAFLFSSITSRGTVNVTVTVTMSLILCL